MKKLLLLTLILLFGTSLSFAQYQLNVTWNASNPNCSCTASADSVFKINVYMRDVANSHDFDEINTTADGKDNSKVIDMPDIEVYCSVLHEYTPSFYITVTVVLHCDDNPPFDACDGKVKVGPKTCADFASTVPISIPVGYLD